MPGLGKSQLGLKYAHSSFELRRHTHIFAISATTVEKLTQGLVGVLNLVQHPERYNSDQAAQLTAARQCLEHSGEYGFVEWLIIFDNATSETVAFLLQHFPRQNANGSILITTRTLEIAEALTNVAGQQHPICELKALSPADSAKILLKRAGIHSSVPADLESAQKLVQRIGCLPLAVDQAGAFMKTNEFQNADRLNDLYDKHGSGEIIRWKNTLTTYEQTSVLAAFTVQFEQLGASNPDVLSFLRVLACLDPGNIPLDMLVLGAEKAREHLASNAESTLSGSPGPKKKRFGFRRLITKLPGKRATQQPLTVLPSVKVPLELIPLLDSICSQEWLREACGHLKDLSLARPLYGLTTSLHIHDLIQQVASQHMAAADAPGEDPYYTFAVALFSQAFETIEDTASPQSWTECERFVPHLMSLMKHVGTLPFDVLGILSVRVAGYFIKRGRYEEAVALCQRVLEGQTHQLGAKHLDTLVTVHRLGDVYERQGKYDDAEASYQRALAGREQQLGADNRATLDTVHGLAILYYRQGGYDKAEPLYQRALTGREQQLGADHPDTLATVHYLATLYMDQKKYQEAEALYQRALAGRDQQLGADHPDTLGTVNNLAILYQRQRKYNKAQPLYQRALAGKERQLGPDHPSTLATVNNLAGLYGLQGNYVEAEALHQRALAGKEQQLGPEHPQTLMTVHNIALLHERQGKYEEAKTLYKRALAGNETSLGIHHPDHLYTLTTVDRLADVYSRQGKDNEAEALYRQALAGREQQLGTDHRATLVTVNGLARLYWQQGKNEKAEPLYQRALAGREQQLGADHPDTLMVVNNLAVLYKKQGNHAEAEALYRRALAGQEQQLGANHPDTLTTVNNLAVMYDQQGKYAEADALYQRALAGWEQQLGPDHPDTLMAVHNIAVLYYKQGKYGDAETLYKRALAGRETSLGIHHPSTIMTMKYLAYV
ncbi:TPR-like protein, partial [Athelia psychrophila]